MIEGILTAIGIGILTGSLYSLIGMGLTLTFGVMRIFNAGHGELYALGGYITIMIASLLTPNPFVTLLISVVALFLVGICAEKLLIKPLRSRVGLGTNALVITLGFSIFLQNLIVLVWGFQFVRAPSFFGLVKIFGVTILGQRLVVVGVSAILLLTLFLFLSKTKIGMATRAVSQDVNTARAVGINADRIYTLTFAIAAALAGAAGSLLSPLLWLTPEIGFGFAIKGITIVVIGGLGSMRGALAASYILGISETFCEMFFIPELAQVIGFWAMIFILAVRPSGLFGKR